MKISTDWDGRNYGLLNGFHPLFRFLEEGPGEAHAASFVVHPYSEKLAAYERFGELSRAQLAEIRNSNAGNLSFEQTWAFFDSDEQFLTEILAGSIYFCHTFPLSLGVRPFVFHLEDIKSLFLPLAAHWGIDVSAVNTHAGFEAYRQYIGSILDSPKCLSIFCHYQETAALLQSVFPDYALHRKVRMLDILSLSRDYCGAVPADDAGGRRRLIYAPSWNEGAAASAHGLRMFVDLCQELRASDLAGHLVPTLIWPAGQEGDIPAHLGVEVFQGPIPQRLRQAIFDQARFRFLSPLSIQTDAIVECLVRGVVPVCYRHAAYSDLGLSDSNAITLGTLSWSALGFHGSPPPIPSTDWQGAIAGLRRFTDAGIAIPGVSGALTQYQGGNIAISSVAQFRQAIAALAIAANPSAAENRRYAGVLQRVSSRHFALSPQFQVHACFNGLFILSKGHLYVYARSSNQPDGMAELLYSGRYFRSAKGAVLFDGLFDLPAAVDWAVSPPLLPGGLVATLKWKLSKHKRLYLFVRDVYRAIKHLRRRFVRGSR